MTLIDTPRLRLRPRVPEDIESIIAMDSDPEVRRFMGGPPDPDIHRKGVLANIIAGRPEAWAIEWKDRAGGFLGMCLLRPLEGTGFTCMGWRLMRQHWGQGLATEAARAVLSHAVHVLGIDPVVAIVDPRKRLDPRGGENWIAASGQRLSLRDAANLFSGGRGRCDKIGVG